MINRLFRWFFADLMKKMAPWYGVSAAASLLYLLVNLLGTGNIVLQFLNGMLLVLGVGLPLICLLMNCVQNWMQTNRNFFQDEAYLIQTLPMKRRAILDAQLLSTLTSSLVSYAFVILSLWVWWQSASKTAGLILPEGSERQLQNFVMAMAAACLMQYLFITVCGLSGLFLSANRKQSRLGWAVLYGVLLYYGVQLVMIVIAFGLLSCFPEWRALLAEGADLNAQKGLELLWLVGVLYFAAILVLTWLGIYRPSKRGWDIE